MYVYMCTVMYMVYMCDWVTFMHMYVESFPQNVMYIGSKNTYSYISEESVSLVNKMSKLESQLKEKGQTIGEVMKYLVVQ